MRTFAIIVLSFIGIPIGIFVVWYWVIYPPIVYRYRVTVAVESDGQLRSGSSVIEIWNRFYPISEFLGGSEFETAVYGEAVLIDLGKRGALVAALNSGTGRVGVSAAELAERAYLPSLVVPTVSGASGIPATPENYKMLSRMRGSADLASDNLPLFIWFSDVSDPRTARTVQPSDFASVIGGQTHLVSARIEMTSDPIVVDLDNRLRWLNQMKEAEGIVRLNATNNGLNDGILKVDGFFLGYTAFVSNGEFQ